MEKIKIQTYKNNRIFNKILEILNLEYEVKDLKIKSDLYKFYEIEVPEDLPGEFYSDCVLRSIDNCIKETPDNYLFAISTTVELGFIGSFSVELIGNDKVFYFHKIKELKK